MKKSKTVKQNHSSSSKLGYPDSYGVGVRNKMAKTIDNSMEMKPISKKTSKKPITLA